MIPNSKIIPFIKQCAIKEGSCPDVVVTPFGNVRVSDYLSPEAISAINAHSNMMA